MKKKFGLKELMEGASLHPGGFGMFILGPIVIIAIMIQYWEGAKIGWNETKAKLSNITLHERVFSEKEKINYFKLTYSFNANDKEYQVYSEEILYGQLDSITRREEEEIKDEKGVKTIYYDGDNPSKNTFIKSETEPKSVMLWGVILTSLIIMRVGYWLVKVTYLHYRT